MDQQQVGHAPERGKRKTLTPRDQNVLAQLERAAGQADNDQRLEHAIFGTGQLVAEDHRDAEDELDLLLERVQGLARDRADRDDGAQAGCDRRGAA